LTALIVSGHLLGVAVTSKQDRVTAKDRHRRTFVLLDKRKSPYGETRVVELEDAYRCMNVNGFDQGGVHGRVGL
jgi:hypothetical protein